jgi:thiol:disulfide interchange protein DsbD
MARLIEHRDRGRVSVVNFTADWCPNCRLVEKTSLHTAHVSDALIKHNAAFYTADLTRENSEGEDLLKALGSRSIPFLAVFPPGRFLEPVCLRDIYSEKDVLRALEEAAAAAPEVDIDSIKFNAP